LPGIIEGAKDGRGRGREVIAVARNADLLLLMVEAASPRQVRTIENELYGFGIRINARAPDVSISKSARGGVTINSTVPLTRISNREMLAALNEYRIFNANVVVRQDITLDEFIDALEGNRAYIPAIYLLTKADLVKSIVKLPFSYTPVSAETGAGLEELRKEIYTKLNLMRVYTKKRGEEADLKDPMVIRRGTSVGMVCEKLHRDLRKEFRFALVWGKSVKHQPQRVGLGHVLVDGDIIQIIKRQG
jgi:ribosome-interacting GTPase 1